MKVCEAPDCGNEFEPKRSTARFCTATCRQRARRSSRAAEAEVIPDPDDGEGKAEHSLMRAVRLDLAKAEALDTVAGQLALQMARRIANPDTAGISALSKELRALLAEAKAEVAELAPAPEPEREQEDEVDRARKAREAKAAAAAAAAGA